MADGRYERHYMLNATLSAKDEASPAFAGVGVSADRLEEKLEKLERTYLIGIELDGDREARREIRTVESDLDKFERKYEADVGINRIDRDFKKFEEDKKQLELFDGADYEAKASLDTSNATKNADRLDERIERIRRSRAQAQAGLEVGKALANADRFEERLSAIDRTVANADAGVDVDDAQLKVLQTELNAIERGRYKALLDVEMHGDEEAAARIRALDAMQADVQLNLDAARFAAGVAASKEEIERLTSHAYSAQLDVDTDTTELTVLKAQLAAATARAYKLTVSAEAQRFPEVAAEVQGLISLAESARSHVVKIRADADTLAATGKLTALYLLARKVAARYKIDLDISALQGAQAILSGIASTGSSVSNAFEQMSISAGRVTQVGNLLQSVVTLVIAGLIALAAAAAGPILAAFTILGAAIVAVTGGLALLAAAAAPAIIAMGASAGAAEKNAQAQETLRNASVAVEGAEQNLAKANQGVADATEQAAQRVSDATRAYNDSLDNVAQAEVAAGRAREEALKGAEAAIQQYNDSLDSVAQAETAAGHAREEALKGVEEAIRSYNDSVDSVAQAERAASDARVSAAENAKRAQDTYRSAVSAAESAERSLTQARTQVTTTTEGLVRAQEDLNRAMRDEPLNQAEAELGVRDAHLGEAEAIQRVAESQQSLNDIRRNPDSTATDIAGAELALQRAQMGTEQASLNAARAQNELSDMRASGSDQLQSATDQQEQALQAQQDAYQGVRDAQGNLVDAQGDVIDAANGITKAQVDGAQSIEDADRSLAKAQDDSNRAYLNIADAQKSGAERVADADLALSKAREQSARDYLGIADAQEQGAQRVADADLALSKAREQSARAYEQIGRAQIEGDKQIAAAHEQVTAAERRLADAQLDYAEKARKAAIATGGLASMIAALPPALQPIATAFLLAFAPATAAMTALGIQINDVAISALPSLGVAALAMALQFEESMQTIAGSWVNNGVLASLQNILNYIPSITGAFSEALGNALGGLINIFSVAMPFVQQFAFWVRDISLRFLEWSASEEGRAALIRFFATAGPLIRTIGYWAWEIAKAIVNWSVEHADLVVAAVQMLGRGLWFVGTVIGPVVTWLLQFAVAHPYVIAIALGIVAIGVALSTLGVLLSAPIAMLGVLVSLGSTIFTVASALGVSALPILGVALGIVAIALAGIVVVAIEVIAHWETISAAASWLATNVPYYFQVILDFLSQGFLGVLAAIGSAIFQMLPIPWQNAILAIMNIWNLLPTWITDTISNFFTGAWATIGQGIMAALPAPWRWAIESILQMMSYFTQASGESGVDAGTGFSTGFLSMLGQAIKNSHPLFGFLISDAITAGQKIAGALDGATQAASDSVSTNFAEMDFNSSTSMDAIMEKANADFAQAQADITAQTTAANENGSAQMAALQANSGASFDELYANSLYNMQSTFTGVDTNLSAANVNGSTYLDSLQGSGSYSTDLLNTNSVTAMGAANEGITTNLDAAQRGGTGALGTLRDTGSQIANEAFLAFTQPFWRTAVEVQNSFNAMIYGVGQIIDAMGLSMSKPSSFTVMASSDQFTGNNSGSPADRATGGVFGTHQSNAALMARGGVVPQMGTGGMADGRNPRIVYGEAGSPEAYIVKDRPTAEQAPYIKTAANWHDMDVVPKGRGRARGGITSMGSSLARSLGATGMYTGGVIDFFSPPDEEWTPAVLDLVSYVESHWPVSGNSYYGHGEQGGSTSGNTVDFWGPGGQGMENIDPATADAIVSYILSSVPFGYMISQGMYYDAASDSSFPFEEDPHYDHLHVSLTGGWGGGVGGGSSGAARMQAAIQQYLPDSLISPANGAFASAGTMDAVVQGTQQKVLASVREKMMASAPRSMGLGMAVGSDIIEMIHSVFPEDAWDMAETVASRESGGNPLAYNSSGASGIFQIMPSTAEGIGGDADRLFDAAYNIALAAKLYDLQGWAPWAETAYAKGGVINKPHVGMIGEKGPEAVLPLTNKKAMRDVGNAVARAEGKQIGHKWKDVPHLRTQKQVDAKAARMAKREEAANAASSASSSFDTGMTDFSGKGTAPDASMGAMPTGSDGATPVTDTGVYDGLGGVQDQMGSLNDESNMQTANLDAVGSQMSTCCGEQVGAMGAINDTVGTGNALTAGLSDTAALQSGQLSGLQDTGTAQMSTLTSMETTDSNMYTNLQALGNTTDYQTGQLSDIANTGITQSSQLTGLQATDTSTYDETQYQTGQLADIADTAATGLGTANEQLGLANEQLGVIADATQAYAQAGDQVATGPGTAYAENRVGTNPNNNVQIVGNTQNTGKAQGRGSSINVGGTNVAGSGSGGGKLTSGSLGTPTPSYSAGAVPVTDMGTQNQLASQGQRMGAVQNKEMSLLGDVGQATGDTQQTVDELQATTAGGNEDITSLLQEISSSLNDIDSKMSSLAGQIAGAMDERIAENPNTQDSLDRSAEQKALASNFGG